MAARGEARIAELTADLYAADPDGFVTRRDAVVRDLRGGGETEAAARVAKLRRPTRSAWALNLLARADPEAVAGLVDLGEALRSAQDALDGAQLRRLGPQRRQVLNALARRAVELARLDGASSTVRDEITATLDAALADPATADALRAGVLDRARQPGGFGAAPDAVSDAVSDAAPRPAQAGPADGRAATRAAERAATKAAERAATRAAERAATKAAERADAAERRRRLREARSAATRAEAALAKATDAEHTAAAALRRAEDELVRRRDEHARARDRLDEATEATAAHEAALEAAQRALLDADRD